MPLALIAVIVSAIFGYSYVGSQSTSISIAGNVVHQAEARYVAESGMELAIAYIKDTSNWRTTRPNGVWVADRPFGSGMYTMRVEDGVD